MELPILYKKDTKGNIRSWQAEINRDEYRTISGLVGGKLITSEWTIVYGKNSGKSNETTSEEQCLSEVQSMYKKKMDSNYYSDIELVDGEKFYKPMLATKWHQRKNKISYSDNIYIDPKLDGVRCIATSSGLYSRTGKKIISCDHIIEELSAVFEGSPDLVLDGELYNHELKEDFNRIISLVKKTKITKKELDESRALVQYHIYDMPSSDLFFSERKEILSSIIPKSDHLVVVSSTKVNNEDELDEAYSNYVSDGYEGGMIRIDGPYEQKRSNNLIKRKDFDDSEFKILRLEEGKGNWSGAAKRIIFKLEDGRECGAGLKGTYEYGKTLLENKESYIGKTVTVQYFGLTPDGIPRFPIAKILHKEARW